MILKSEKRLLIGTPFFASPAPLRASYSATNISRAAVEESKGGFSLTASKVPVGAAGFTLPEL